MIGVNDLAAVDAFVAALRERSDETRAAADALIAPGVSVFGPFGVGAGSEAVDGIFDHPLIARLLGAATWSGPLLQDGVVVVTATAPPAAAVGGLNFGFHLDGDGRIDRIEQDLLPAAPLTPNPVALTDAHAELLLGALENGTPVIVGYADADGKPHLSYRATLQVIAGDQLGMWIRDPRGGLVRALPTNPNLACFYSDRTKGVTLQFMGRGRVVDDDAIRTAIYDASPKLERDMDWRRGGVAVVVDVERVEGRDSSGRVLMAK